MKPPEAASKKPTRILRLRAVVDRTGDSPSAVHRDRKLGLFPEPVKIGARAVGWVESEIDELIMRRIRERDERLRAKKLEAAS
jgi:prophage regulatory protein